MASWSSEWHTIKIFDYFEIFHVTCFRQQITARICKKMMKEDENENNVKLLCTHITLD